MARARKLECIADYERSLKNKYGVGTGCNYKPWLKVQDVKSHGKRSEIWGIKSQRVHHTLSSLETELFYLAEHCCTVIDIREQFPLLPLKLSQKISTTLNISYPKHPITKEPIIITTDFLLTKKINNQIYFEAICVKPAEKLLDERTLEKIEIERVLWELLNVKFSIFTGNKLTKIQSRNISWLTAPTRSNSVHFTQDQKSTASDMLLTGKFLIKDICEEFSDQLEIQKENALNLLKVLFAEKYINLDLNCLIEESGIVIISVPTKNKAGLYGN